MNFCYHNKQYTSLVLIISLADYYRKNIDYDDCRIDVKTEKRIVISFLCIAKSHEKLNDRIYNNKRKKVIPIIDIFIFAL